MEYGFTFKDKQSFENVIKYNSKNTNPCIIQGFVYMYNKKTLQYFNKILFLMKKNNKNLSELFILFFNLNQKNVIFNDKDIDITTNRIFDTYEKSKNVYENYKHLSIYDEIYFLYRNIYNSFLTNTIISLSHILDIKDIKNINSGQMFSNDVSNINNLNENIKSFSTIRNFSIFNNDKMISNIENYNNISILNYIQHFSYLRNLTQIINSKNLDKIFNLYIDNNSSIIFRKHQCDISNLNKFLNYFGDSIKKIDTSSNLNLTTDPINIKTNKYILASVNSKNIYTNNNFWINKFNANIFETKGLNVDKEMDFKIFDNNSFINKAVSSNDINMHDIYSFSYNISCINIFNNLFVNKRGISYSIYNNLYKCFSNKDGNINIYNIESFKANPMNIDTFNITSLRHIFDNKALSIFEQPYRVIDIDNPRKMLITKTEKFFQKKSKDIHELINDMINLCNDHTINIRFNEIMEHITKTEKFVFNSKALLYCINKKRDFDINDFMIEVIKHNRDIILDCLGIRIQRTSKDNMVNNTYSKTMSVPRNFNLFNESIIISKIERPFTFYKDLEYISKVARNVRSDKLLWYQKKKRQVGKKNTFNVYLSELKKQCKNIKYDIKDLSVSSSIKPIKISDKLIELSNVMQDMALKTDNMIALNDTIKNIFSDRIQFLSNTIKNIYSEEDMFLNGKNRDINIFKDLETWNKLFKEISTLPFINDILVDKIAKDVIMFDYGVGVTTDDFIMQQGNGVDELLLPHEDFNYSSLKKEIFDYKTGKPIDPIKQIDETTFIARYPVDHAFETGKEIGREYLDLNVSILKYMIDVYYLTWQEHIFEFGTMDLRTGLNQMLKYLQIFIEYRIPYNIREHAERCFQLFRWYSENIAMRNSKYKIHFTYKPWKSNLYEGSISCPHTLRNVIINSKYVLVNTNENAEIELQQEVRKDGIMQFDVGITLGKLDVYVNGVNSVTVNCNKRIQLPIKKGKLNVKFIFQGKDMKIGNILIDNCEFEDITTEYEFDPGSANLGMDKVTKNICNYFMVTKENFDDIKQGIQGALSLRDVTNRLLEYYQKHHQNKTKGKRLTIKKEML